MELDENVPGPSLPEEDTLLVEEGAANSSIVARQEAWSGPLPPPRVLEDFNNVVTDGAERIFSAWENETKHRQALEAKELNHLIRDAILGKIFAFVFVMTSLGAATLAALNGSEIFATVLGGGTIGSVVWAFVNSRPKQ